MRQFSAFYINSIPMVYNQLPAIYKTQVFRYIAIKLYHIPSLGPKLTHRTGFKKDLSLPLAALPKKLHLCAAVSILQHTKIQRLVKMLL